ncbi:MAG: sugar transferase [Elusimicrobia bacterium]|nr:sugar transferase [Elusimicrobiota bacterium]
MKAVILMGGSSNWLYPLTHQTSRAMLPVGNVPALSHLFTLLQRSGVTDVHVPLSPRNEDVRAHFGDGGALLPSIHYREEAKYLGTAGSVALFADELKDAPFLIVNGNSFLRLDLSPILTIPSALPFLVAGVQEGGCGDCAGADRPLGTLFWETCHCRLAHVYCAHPEALSLIPRDRYFDIREQLVPAALAGGIDVRGALLQGAVNPLRTFQDYLSANHEAALRSSPGRAGSGVRVAASASLHGSIILGENVTIGEDAVIVGPTVIGDRTEVGNGVVVHQSVVDSNVRIGRDSVVRHSIVLEGAHVKNESRLSRSLAFNGVQFPRGHRSLLNNYGDDGSWKIRTNGSLFKEIRHRGPLSEALKRAMDLGVTLLFGPAIALACLALGLVHKLTSPGPVFFREKRLSKGGREFTMLKIRTMQAGAHLQQGALRAKNESDGPMFKIEHDPRITPMGRWLRKTSLDELPQFWNVLKGEMSLVGPRPLADAEMRLHPSWRDLRLRVKPGLTGPWQVWCGITSDFSSWIVYDSYYVQNGSLWLDLRLILETAAMVFRGRSPR